MIQKLDSIKKQLAELATALNAFKSEAVQLRLLDFLLGDIQSTVYQPLSQCLLPPHHHLVDELCNRNVIIFCIR